MAPWPQPAAQHRIEGPDQRRCSQVGQGRAIGLGISEVALGAFDTKVTGAGPDTEHRLSSKVSGAAGVGREYAALAALPRRPMGYSTPPDAARTGQKRQARYLGVTSPLGRRNVLQRGQQ